MPNRLDPDVISESIHGKGPQLIQLIWDGRADILSESPELSHPSISLSNVSQSCALIGPPIGLCDQPHAICSTLASHRFPWTSG
jgi:hypothetical protein